VKERRLTVGYTPGLEFVEPLPAVPLLRLSGRWLALVGFAVGAKVRVQVEERRLVLTPLRASEGAPCR